MNHYIDITIHYRQYEKTQQNLRTGVRTCKHLLRAHKIQSLKRPFFCQKCHISYTRYGRSGRAASCWPFSEYGILTPVRSATIP